MLDIGVQGLGLWLSAINVRDLGCRGSVLLGFGEVVNLGPKP